MADILPRAKKPAQNNSKIAEIPLARAPILIGKYANVANVECEGSVN